MSKFLDSTGLSRLVENIKNKFQPKPFLLELSVSYDRQTHEGSVSIREDDIARAFDHLYKYKDSSDYNISFKVYNSYYERAYICKANSIAFKDDVIFQINIDYNLLIADDGDQDIGHIRLDLDRESVEGYYDEQNILYEDVLLTGTGTTRKKTYCKIFNDGGYWSITIDNKDYEIVRDGAALYEVIKYKLDDLTFDIEEYNNYSLYNVNYNTYKYDDGSILIILTGLKSTSYDEPETNIFKVGISLSEDVEGEWNIYEGDSVNISNLGKVNNLKANGNGTKFLADDGKYKIIGDTYYSFDFTNDEYYKFQGSNLIDEYDLENKADVIRLYNSLKADIGKPTFARVITDDIDGYSNDGFNNVTIEENGEDSLFVTFNIVDFYADGTDTDNMILAKKTMDICANAEDSFCNIYDSHVIGLTTSGSGMSVLNDKGEYSINDVMFEYLIEDGEINILDPTDNSVYSNFVIGENDEFKEFYNIFRKIISTGAVIRFRVVYENTSHIVIPKIKHESDCYTIICTFIYSENPDDEIIYICKSSLEISKTYGGRSYAVGLCRVDLNNLSMVGYLYDAGEGNKFLADDGGYMPISVLITFEAENGSLNAEQIDAIEEGYHRNLPIYVLYSGIKMLVNGIQKLGDIYSLSCRHDNSTYSITMNLDDETYEISSISE